MIKTLFYDKGEAATKLTLSMFPRKKALHPASDHICCIGREEEGRKEKRPALRTDCEGINDTKDRKMSFGILINPEHSRDFSACCIASRMTDWDLEQNIIRRRSCPLPH